MLQFINVLINLIYLMFIISFLFFKGQKLNKKQIIVFSVKFNLDIYSEFFFIIIIIINMPIDLNKSFSNV